MRLYELHIPGCILYRALWVNGALSSCITNMVSAFENCWEQRSNCLVYHQCGFIFMIPGQRYGVTGSRLLGLLFDQVGKYDSLMDLG